MLCWQGGLGDIKKELDTLRNQASVLDGATKTGNRADDRVRRRQLGSGRRDAAVDRGGYGSSSGSQYDRGGLGGASGKGRWSDEDQRLLDESLKQQMAKQERPGTSFKTVFIITLVFLMIGPFRQLLIKLVKQALAADAGSADAATDDGFEF